MNAEYIMQQLRRIVGANMRQLQSADLVVKNEGGTKTRRGAIAIGERHGIQRILDDMCVTFDIDPWNCMGEEGK